MAGEGQGQGQAVTSTWEMHLLQICELEGAGTQDGVWGRPGKEWVATAGSKRDGGHPVRAHWKLTYAFLSSCQRDPA